MQTTASVPQDTRRLVLDDAICLELLDRCGVACLACTVNALPSVIPVTVRITGSAILLGLGAGGEPVRLDGQIVALGAGVPATPRSEGWWVVVRGELRLEAGTRGTFRLDPYEVWGRALPASRRAGWWRC